MKLFQEKPEVHQYGGAQEFVEDFQIGEGDFVLAGKSVLEAHFAGLEKTGAVIRCKSRYGQGEPTDLMVDALLADFRKTGCGRIIAIGGGAVIDMAKILVLDGDAPAADIYQRRTELNKVRSLVSVPTTCGAGSEVSSVSIAEVTELHTKLGLACDEIYPDHAVLIPELLKELPWHFFVTSAIDALIHAIESYVSPKSNLYTRMFAKQAMEMLLGGFRKLAGEGQGCRESLYEEFLVASNMAGISFANAGTGAVHAMSYPLSGVYHVTHGEANYQFLTAVFQAYQEKAPEGDIGGLNEFLAGILGCGPGRVYREIEELLGSLIQRKPLREYGMKEEEIRAFAESVEATQQRLLNQSYVKFTADEMEEIYRKLY
ncbi:4-hydroxybutyrate dehydrogenase [Faecalicatena contorta]|uniref:4-hydroxybutyrate dehydrogenase n=1 Tax=Faecalicatena contorta TaxID=39482 RepID=UPI00195F6CE3|nr:4-hydroxybutyrate dehydrogenase [Faecalicatena contorta]MBM6686057.1 4-hydroxybutyrate dehydrogenase [Faecalicatena contorta]MBM6710675.1 4-hydroxybutyrate dehydrogenase [Faecalicatena contorta]